MSKNDAQKGNILKNLGTRNVTNGAGVLRFIRHDKRKEPLHIRKGQILVIGKDITEKEAEHLLALPNWKFERVNNNG